VIDVRSVSMFRRMFLLVVLIVAFAGIDTWSAVFPGPGHLATDAAAQDELLDLAWLAPDPDDLDVEGYGLTYGVYQTAAAGGVSVYGNPGPLTEYDEAFAAGSPRQTYYQLLSLRSDDDPDVVARRLSMVLAEFDDDDAAETGFAAVADVFATYDQTRTPPEVGDEAVAFRGEFTSSDGLLYQELRILVRIGHFLADLAIDDYSGDAPATSELTPLAELLVERLENPESAEGPGLGVQLVRLVGEDLTTFHDYYTRRGEDEVPAEGERASLRQSDDEFFDETGGTDFYYYTAEVLPTDEDPTVLSLNVDLRLFTDDEAASDYLETAADDWAGSASTTYQDVEVVDDVEELGDGSVTVSYAQDSSYGSLVGYRTWVQIGDRVAAVELDGDPAISLSVAENVARAQLACLEDEGCTGPIPTAELTQAEPGASAEETPQAQAQDTAEDETPVAESSSEPSTEATAETSQDTSGEATTKPSEVATEITVSITDDAFDPDSVTVPVDGTVTWVNRGSLAHVVLVTGGAGEEFTSEVLLPNFGSASHTFTEPGTYTFVDATNVANRGTITVEPSAEATGDTSAEANQDASGESAAAPDGASAATETYVSPSFGYELSYDPAMWTVVEGPSTDADGLDVIGLRAGFSTIYLSGIPGAYDAQSCVQFMTDQQTSEANVVGFEPLLDEAGEPQAGGDPTDAFATTRITRTTEDGTELDQAFYGRCIALPSVNAMLAIQQFAAEIIYDAAAEDREQLLEGLTLP
jgi:plastocyanin